MHAYLRAFDVVVKVISKGVDEVDGLITSCIVLEVPRKQHCAEKQTSSWHLVLSHTEVIATHRDDFTECAQSTKINYCSSYRPSCSSMLSS